MPFACSVSPQLSADLCYRPLLHRLSTTHVMACYGTLRKVYEVHRRAEVHCRAVRVHRRVVRVHRGAVKLHRRAVKLHCRAAIGPSSCSYMVHRRAVKVHHRAAESSTRCRCSKELQVICKVSSIRIL